MIEKEKIQMKLSESFNILATQDIKNLNEENQQNIKNNVVR